MQFPGKFLKDPSGRDIWENADNGRSSVLEEKAIEDIPDIKPQDRSQYKDCKAYLALEWPTKDTYPVIVRRGATDVEGVWLGLYKAPTKAHGSIGAMRADPVVDYLWTGDEAVGEKAGLNPEYYRKTAPGKRWLPVFTEESGLGVKVFKKAPGRTVFGPERGAATPKGYLPNSLEKPADPLKRKGERPGGSQKPPGVAPTKPGVRKSQKVAMGGKTANEAAKAAGHTIGDDLQPYEWCHLIGHGEGGKEVKGNLVAATRAANTEQLAIEEAYRWARRKYPRQPILAKVTAYTVPGHPVANQIRYKLVGANGKNIVDRIIDGKSQRFDLTDFKFLKASVKVQIVNHLFPGTSAKDALQPTPRKPRRR